MSKQVDDMCSVCGKPSIIARNLDGVGFLAGFCLEHFVEACAANDERHDQVDLLSTR